MHPVITVRPEGQMSNEQVPAGCVVLFKAATKKSPSSQNGEAAAKDKGDGSSRVSTIAKGAATVLAAAVDGVVTF